MFKVLRPIYALTGQRTNETEWWAIKWEQIGTALSMEHAKALFGGSPVLQWEAA